MIDDPAALRLSKQMDGGRAAISVAAAGLQPLAAELTRQGVKGHVAPMREAYRYLRLAMKSYETAVVMAAHELALKLEDTLPGYGGKEGGS